MKTAWWWGIMVCLLAGCQSVPSLSADQLSAMPNGSTFCATGTGMWGAVKVTYAKLDQSATGGNVVLDANTCGVTLVSNPAVVAAARAAAAAAEAAKQ